MQEYEHERVERKVVMQADPTPLPVADHTLREPMFRYLTDRYLDYSLAHNNDWYPAQYNGPRIIIPCKRTDGKQWWQARSMNGNEKRWDGAHGYRHDAVCYIHIPCSDTLVVCEGPMDALAIAGTGVAAVAVLGATPPHVVVSHVAQLTISYLRTIIIPDTDRLGAWQQLQARLRDCGIHAPMYSLPNGFKDFAEAPPEARKEFFNTIP